MNTRKSSPVKGLASREFCALGHTRGPDYVAVLVRSTERSPMEPHQRHYFGINVCFYVDRVDACTADHEAGSEWLVFRDAIVQAAREFLVDNGIAGIPIAS
jgi:hypothetical protein